MLYKFQKISNSVFNRKVSVFKERKVDMWGYYLDAKSLLKNFKRLNITFRGAPKPPSWTLKHSLFGPYLAGLIDGDGDVRIKRKNYPQCVIRISSGSKQTALANSIRKILKCSVGITYEEKDSEIEGRKIHGCTYYLEFYVSSKNFRFVNQYILHNISLRYKKEKIENYIKSRWPE